MSRKLLNGLLIIVMLAGLLFVGPARANPIDPGDSILPPIGDEDKVYDPGSRSELSVKPIDMPNPEEYQQNRERQRLLEAGQYAEAAALAQTGEDKALILLVEFTGTDVFTWTVGDTWDPYGRVDPDEWTGTAGDCSKIITETTVFTYTGPLHNELPLPEDGDNIYTPDFSVEWYENILFGEGAVISYTLADGTPVYEDFRGQSVQDYYLDMSGGVYTVTGDIIGWLPIDHSVYYYGADTCPGLLSNYGAGIDHMGAIPGAGDSRTLVMDAIDAVNAQITAGNLPDFDWAEYDNDGDGIIDRLWIVHSGYGEEESSAVRRVWYGEGALWSHSWWLESPYEAAPGIAADTFIIMPENGGIGVFTHEFGHNLGAEDLYSYSGGETSAGFWSLMADDWTGYPIGFEPPAADPWHLDNWGWLEPYLITDTTKVYEITLGQASEFQGGADIYRGAKIQLPDQAIPQDVPVWKGTHYFWGGAEDLANGMMETKNSITIPGGAATATLEFELVYDIEAEWDFLWVAVSDDDGTTWDYLTNENTVCEHDPDWIGAYYGFPDDLCAAGIGGFSGYNANWPDPELQVFDLTAYKGDDILIQFWYMTDWGTVYTGPFLDNIVVKAGGSNLFADNAENGPSKWVFTAPFEINAGVITGNTHNFYLQWRNTNANGGYDGGLGDPRWWSGPSNTGLLVWYNDNRYSGNEIINNLAAFPSFGPKGRMLVVDSHPYPYRDPYWVENGYNNEGGNVNSRSLMRDAPFTLVETVNFEMRQNAVYTTTQFEGLPAANAFHDALGYYPGAEYVSRGPGYDPVESYAWVTTQWDSSVVVPAKDYYSFRAPGYKANEPLRFGCEPFSGGRLGCYWFPYGIGTNGGNGNPADVNAQYGWHVEVIEEAADHTWAKVRVWNSKYAVDARITSSDSDPQHLDIVTYNVELTNAGSNMRYLACVPILSGAVNYVANVAYEGVVPVASCPTPEETMSLDVEGLQQLAAAPDQTVGGVMVGEPWAEPGEKLNFSFDVQVLGPSTDITGEVIVYSAGKSLYVSTLSDEIVTQHTVFMPAVR